MVPCEHRSWDLRFRSKRGIYRLSESDYQLLKDIKRRNEVVKLYIYTDLQVSRSDLLFLYVEEHANKPTVQIIKLILNNFQE